MRRLSSTVAMILTMATGSARAADAVTPGFGAALRLSYGVPLGKVTGVQGDDLSAVFSWSLPVQVDLGYRFTPTISVAVYGQFALASLTSSIENLCTNFRASCSGRVVRAGVEGFYHFVPASQLDPWFGIGVGYEWARVGGDSVTDRAIRETVRGFELFDAQVGADWRITPQLGAGPFVQVSFGRYSTQEAGLTNGTRLSQDIGNKSVHEWLQVGVRGTFNL
jgi:outer membrane protein with beta-barrel domain